jgi:anaphase-promoting complex subunit 4
MLETSTTREFYTYVIGAPAKPTHQSNTKVCELGLWHQVFKPDGSEGNGWRQIILPSSSPTPSSISALKFLDDETFLCLFCFEEVVYLLCLPYRSPSDAGDPPNQWRTMEDLFSAGCVAHTFDDEQTWIPKWIIANGKKNRRNCVVVEESKKKWKIFDLEGFRSGNIDGADLVESDENEEGDEEESMVF